MTAIIATIPLLMFLCLQCWIVAGIEQIGINE